MFSVAAAMLWVYIVQCKHDKITLEFSHACLLLLTNYIKPHVTTMLSRHTTWRRNTFTAHFWSNTAVFASGNKLRQLL